MMSELISRITLVAALACLHSQAHGNDNLLRSSSESINVSTAFSNIVSNDLPRVLANLIRTRTESLQIQSNAVQQGKLSKESIFNLSFYFSESDSRYRDIYSPIKFGGPTAATGLTATLTLFDPVYLNRMEGLVLDSGRLGALLDASVMALGDRLAQAISELMLNQSLFDALSVQIERFEKINELIKKRVQLGDESPNIEMVSASNLQRLILERIETEKKSHSLLKLLVSYGFDERVLLNARLNHHRSDYPISAVCNESSARKISAEFQHLNWLEKLIENEIHELRAELKPHLALTYEASSRRTDSASMKYFGPLSFGDNEKTYLTLTIPFQGAVFFDRRNSRLAEKLRIVREQQDRALMDWLQECHAFRINASSNIRKLETFSRRFRLAASLERNLSKRYETAGSAYASSFEYVNAALSEIQLLKDELELKSALDANYWTNLRLSYSPREDNGKLRFK